MLQSVPGEGDPRHALTPADLPHAAIPNICDVTEIPGLLFPQVLSGWTGCHKSHPKHSGLINPPYGTPAPQQGLLFLNLLDPIPCLK